MGNNSEKPMLDHKKLAELIKKSGKTQEEFAEAIGTSDRHLRTLKSKDTDVSVSLATRIGWATDSPVESMLTIEKCQPPVQTEKPDSFQQMQKEFGKVLATDNSIKRFRQSIHGLLSAMGIKYERQNINNDTFESVCQELSEILSLLLNYFKKSATLKVGAYSLNKLIMEIVQNRMTQFAAHNVDIKLVLDNNLPDMIFNKKYIKKVFSNCLNNSLTAISASKQPYGQIYIWTYFDQIHGRLKIIIADTGNGLPQEPEARFLKPFRTPKLKNSNVSMSINLAIIKQHGGNMSVNNQPEKGCCIRIELPIQGIKQFNNDEFYQEIINILL